jgi:hypothetical protein
VRLGRFFFVFILSMVYNRIVKKKIGMEGRGVEEMIIRSEREREGVLSSSGLGNRG